MGYSDSRDDQSRPWCPPVDVHRTDHRYKIFADIPGMSKDRITVTTKGNTLAISGNREFEPDESAEEHLRLERIHGKFICEVHLPGNLLAEAMKVGYAHGVLSVEIPIG